MNNTTRCPVCKKRINKMSMTACDGRKMCPKCKREAIEQKNHIDEPG